MIVVLSGRVEAAGLNVGTSTPNGLRQMTAPSGRAVHYRTPAVDLGRCMPGNLVPDAHVAALAIEHGLVLCSTDGDFARFDGLEWLNPLK